MRLQSQRHTSHTNVYIYIYIRIRVYMYTILHTCAYVHSYRVKYNKIINQRSCSFSRGSPRLRYPFIAWMSERDEWRKRADKSFFARARPRRRAALTDISRLALAVDWNQEACTSLSAEFFLRPRAHALRAKLVSRSVFSSAKRNNFARCGNLLVLYFGYAKSHRAVQFRRNATTLKGRMLEDN